MEDDTKLTISQIRENGSLEIVYEVSLESLMRLKAMFPNTYGKDPICVGDYLLRISIDKST